MTDHSELKRLAEAIESCTSIPEEDEAAWMRRTTGRAVVVLIDELDERKAENKLLIAELKVASNVGRCHGMALGSVVESRDALVRVADQLKAENKRIAELLECAQGDLKQAMQIIEKDSKPLDDLISENEVLCSKIASMNVSGFGEAFYQVAERLGVTGARPVSPMQVFASEVMPALDAAIKDAERYRFVSKLAWYVERGAQVYDLCNVNSPWRIERGSPDEDDVQDAIDIAMNREG